MVGHTQPTVVSLGIFRGMYFGGMQLVCESSSKSVYIKREDVDVKVESVVNLPFLDDTSLCPHSR